MDLVQVTSGVTLSNATLFNSLFFNSYFKNLTVGLHVLHNLNMHTNFHVNRMLFTIQFINSYFIYYFKLQKLKFKQLIDDMTIGL